MKEDGGRERERKKKEKERDKGKGREGISQRLNQPEIFRSALGVIG